MALDASRLANVLKPTIKAAFVAAGGDATRCDPLAQALATAIASAVVDEITTHAEVTPTLLVAPPSGGPVTGTGAVT